MAQVDNTPPTGAEEEGIVQPAFAVFQSAADENLLRAETDQSFAMSRFKGRHVPNTHDPTAQIVSQ
jgi:hypothetical protein